MNRHDSMTFRPFDDRVTSTRFIGLSSHALLVVATWADIDKYIAGSYSRLSLRLSLIADGELKLK